MTGIIYKFPYNVSRRAYSRMGRCSKNGTPEERAAKAATTQPDPASLANVVQLSRKPAVPVTLQTAEEQAEFRALLTQLDPASLDLVHKVLLGMVNKRHPQ